MKITDVAFTSLKDNIAHCSPDLIDRLNIIFQKNPALKTYSAEYKYGDYIARQGSLVLPEEGQKFAFGVVVRGGIEVFMQQDEGDESEKVTTLAMLEPGNILFLHKDLDSSSVPLHMQYVTAGARAIFFLSKICNSDCLFRLAKRNNIDFEVCLTIFQQWHLFKALAKALQSRWRAHIILFTEEWLYQGLNSADLKQYLTAQGIPTSNFNANKHEIDSAVGGVIQRKSELYAAQVIKNVLAIAAGDLPGFSFIEDDNFAPIKLIQDVFKKDYGLKTLDIMHPGYIKPGVDCFYSFEFNSSIDQYAHISRKVRQSSYALVEDVQKIYDRLMEYHGKKGIEKCYEYNQVRLEFLHAGSSSLIEEGAVYFSHNRRAPFLRNGCIAIKPN